MVKIAHKTATIQVSVKDKTYSIGVRRNSVNVSRNVKGVKIDRKAKTVRTEHPDTTYAVKEVTKTYQFTSRGRGEKGDPGEGLPPGGLPGQTIVKASTNDYDTEWSSVSGSDKNYILSFTSAQSLNIAHNLAKLPSVTILDSAGDEVYADVNHVNINNVFINFSAPFTGVVSCN